MQNKVNHPVQLPESPYLYICFFCKLQFIIYIFAVEIN